MRRATLIAAATFISAALAAAPVALAANRCSADTLHQTATGSLRRPQLDVHGHLETHMNHDAQPTSTPTTGDRR
jgi:hypothetical protein